ncbi:hypothetical protein FB107DRAFT_276040 [Schizophyllum commune]
MGTAFRLCPTVGCNKILRARGYHQHVKTCRDKQSRRAIERERAQIRRQNASLQGDAGIAQVDDSATIRKVTEGVFIEGEFVQGDIFNGDILPPLPPESPSFAPTSLENDPEPSEPSRPAPKLGDVKIEFHPHSGKPPVIVPLADLRREGDDPSDTQGSPPLSLHPGFRTALDYEVCEFMLHARLSREETKRLVHLIQCAQRTQEFTIEDIEDIDKRWNLAAQATHVPGFTTTEFRSEGEGYSEIHEVHHTSIMEWMRSLAADPALKDYFVWNAQRMYIHNGQRFERFVDEPYTANRLWNIQDLMHPKATPFGAILYVDKSKLSSFSSEEAYPIAIMCVNLATGARLGGGLGGPRIAGWLPILRKTSGNKNKTRFVNYRGIVWHDAMLQFLEDIAKQPPEGVPIKCADDVVRFLLFFILILAADYEEQAIMALIRGVRGNFPCPQCLVPQDQLADLSKQHRARDVVHMINTVNRALKGTGGEKPNAEQREQILSAVSLRPAGNVFWKIPFSGPYSAFCFDTLHFIWTGLAEHLSDQLKLHVKQSLGRTARNLSVDINEQIAAIPRWRDLNHFEEFMELNFNDGSKHEDASKALIFGMHAVFSPSSPELWSSAGYQLLRAYRYYIEMTMFACMDVMTESRSDEGRRRLSKFHEQLSIYREQVASDTETFGKKDWNFPKIHLHAHLFDSIWDKGATRTQSTKPFEKLHGPLRKIYLEQTNFKNVPRQVLGILHRHYVAAAIREGIDSFNESTSEEDKSTGACSVPHVFIGSPDVPLTFKSLEIAKAQDRAFTNFRTRLQNSMHNILQVFYGIRPQGNRRLASFHAEDKIKPYKYLQVEYSSQVDWRLTRDYLRCNPNFYNRPRFDYVLLNREEVLKTRGQSAGRQQGRNADPFVLAQLLYVFTCSIDGKDYPVALVHALDATRGHTTKEERDLGLIRRRARPRKDSEFVSLHSVVRGAVAIQDLDCQERDEYFLYNYLDFDMFLHMTGTLTQNGMTIVTGWLGVKAKFVCSLEENKARMNAADSEAAPEDELSKQRGDFYFFTIAINSTAFKDTDAKTGIITFVESKTETALLKWAKELGRGDFHAMQDVADMTLCTIALCYRESEQWQPAGAEVDEEGEVAYNVLVKGRAADDSVEGGGETASSTRMVGGPSTPAALDSSLLSPVAGGVVIQAGGEREDDGLGELDPTLEPSLSRSQYNEQGICDASKRSPTPATCASCHAFSPKQHIVILPDLRILILPLLSTMKTSTRLTSVNDLCVIFEPPEACARYLGGPCEEGGVPSPVGNLIDRTSRRRRYPRHPNRWRHARATSVTDATRAGPPPLGSGLGGTTFPTCRAYPKPPEARAGFLVEQRGEGGVPSPSFDQFLTGQFSRCRFEDPVMQRWDLCANM